MEETHDDLIKQAKANYEVFLNKESRNLITFTKDATLRYLPNATAEKFSFNAKQKTITIPLAGFLDDDYDEYIVLWHIYYEMALYPYWRKDIYKYASRTDSWNKEINYFVHYLSNKIGQDDVYTKPVLYQYVKKEFDDFLYILNRLEAYLIVSYKCPIFQGERFKKEIYNYFMSCGYDKKDLKLLPSHQMFAKSFLAMLIHEEASWHMDAPIQPQKMQLAGRPYPTIIMDALKNMIVNETSFDDKEEFIKTMIYPYFKELWCFEIDHMSQSNQSDGDSNGSYEMVDDTMEQKEEASLESNDQEQKEVLQDLLDEEKEHQSMMEDSLDNSMSLSQYGVEQDAMELFHHYEKEVEKQRVAMQAFWRKLVGNAKKEANVKKTMQTKGKLNVDDLVQNYATFFEAEELGSYKNLPIFYRYELESQPNVLPDCIEIVFVLDNSGSMNEQKIDAARKALAITLLSLDDFNTYLDHHAQKLNQKISLDTSVWLFGSQFYEVKTSNKKKSKEEKSQIVQSIAALNGQDGATDDATCLKEILEGITRSEENELRSGRKIKMIFEITDGASSFPGSAKKSVDGIIKKNAEIYAFQIGKNTDSDISIFDYVWNENTRYPRGMHIGEDIDTLPMQLMTTVAQNLESIFTK